MWIIGVEAKHEGDQVEKLMLNAEKFDRLKAMTLEPHGLNRRDELL